MENLSYMLAPLFSSKLLIVLFFGTLFGLILGVLPGTGSNNWWGINFTFYNDA